MLDWPRLATLDQRVPLDIDRYLRGTPSPIWGTLSTHLSTSGHKALTYVAEDQGAVVAVGQAAPRQGSWHVTHLAAHSAPCAQESAAHLSTLLVTLGQAVSERGGLRLYARVSRDHPAIEAFARAGFATYTYENVYALSGGPSQRSEPVGADLRPQENSDAWGIYQLYCTITPNVVQQAEGRDAAYWELPPVATRALAHVNDRRWVLMEEGRILGHIHVDRLALRLHLLIHPEAYRYGRAVVAAGVKELLPRQPVRCCLPEYQGGLGRSLEEAGFRFVGTQAVLVKHLVAQARAENRARRPVFEPTLKPVRAVDRPCWTAWYPRPTQ